MKQLLKSIKHEGHDLSLIHREGNLALYSTTRAGESTHGYIVAKIQHHGDTLRTLPDGNTLAIVAGESLPREKEFGRLAWFFRCEKKARIKFEQLQQALESRRKGQGV